MSKTAAKKKKTASRRRTSPTTKRQNVFEDLGFSKTESAELLRKADLHAHILGIYQDRGYTQFQLSEILGQKQPHVSRLLTGKLEDISVEKMISYLEKLGAEVEVKIIVKRPA